MSRFERYDDFIAKYGKINEDCKHYVDLNMNGKTDEEFIQIMHGLKGKKIVHTKIGHMILLFNEIQFKKFIEEYNKLPEQDQGDENIQIYICALILYPEYENLLNMNDEFYVKEYNAKIICNNPNQESIQKITLGKNVCYDYFSLKKYKDFSESEKKTYIEWYDILIKFKSLCYETCCGRTEGTIYEYMKLLKSLNLSDKAKMEQIAEYIVLGKYKSLYVAKEICEYFKTLTPEEMKFRFTRAKEIWPDCYINKSHKFEKLFVDLLKINKVPSEDELKEMVLKDIEPRQDIDYCYFGFHENEVINEITKKRFDLDVKYCDYELV